MEERFGKKFGFGFDEFSMNPLDKPNIDPGADRTLLGKEYSEKFDVWLKSSPYGVWVTKYTAKEPYAVCKYKNCGHLFSYEGNPTSSNIITHLRRNHRHDFELFQRKVNGIQPELSEFKGVLSINKKPFPIRRELTSFMFSNRLKISQLNLFIETIIPFSTAEAPAFRQLLDCWGAKNRAYIRSRKGLISLMERYEKELNAQMKAALSKSFNYNILLDMWSSSSQRSYLAVIVSFCPNLSGNEGKLTLQDVITDKTPNAHVIDFVDLSDQRHTGESIRQALLAILAKYSISHKVASITLDNGTNNISMLQDLDNDIRGGPGVNKEGGMVKIRCMNHVLNRVFSDVMKRFEKDQQSLISRIDRLTTIMKNNTFIRNKLSTFLTRIIPKHNATKFLYHYRQFSTFLKLSDGIKNFYFENRLDSNYQLTPDDLSLFCYERAEMETLEFFLRLTRIFHEYTMLLQDDSLNALPNGIEYYMQIDNFFTSCEQIRNGSTDKKHLQNTGLKKKHLHCIEETSKCAVLSAVMDAYPKFQKYLEIALAETGYWVAHFLQPYCKTAFLMSNFGEDFRQKVRSSADRYVNDYLAHFRDEARGNKSQRFHSQKTSGVKEPRKRGYKVLKHLRRRSDQNVVLEKFNYKSEWELYLEEPVHHDIDYLEYWLMNQDRFPFLFQLALSFYHTKLSTADVERCFSVSKRVLENRFSLSSINLKRTMIIRNRLKCFGIGHSLQEVKDIPVEQWIEDEGTEGYSNGDSQSFAMEVDHPSDILCSPESDSSDGEE